MMENHSAISKLLLRSVSLSLGGIAFAAILGCGKPAEPRGPVGGKVTFRKAPVAEGIVAFANAEKGVYMNANIKPDGSYEVLTVNGPGLPAGEYAIAVVPPTQAFQTGPIDRRAHRKEFPNIPPRYRDPKTSGLKLTVKTGENPPFDIDMKE